MTYLRFNNGSYTYNKHDISINKNRFVIVYNYLLKGYLTTLTGGASELGLQISAPLAANNFNIINAIVTYRNVIGITTATEYFSVFNNYISYPAVFTTMILGVSDSEIEEPLIEGIDDFKKLNNINISFSRYDILPNVPNVYNLEFVFDEAVAQKFLNFFVHNKVMSDDDYSYYIDFLKNETGDPNIASVDFTNIYNVRIDGEII